MKRALAIARRERHPLGLLVAALALYLSGLPPSITWAHDASDGPELAAAVATWSVPHPPGYPTYVLVGRLFLLVPWGDPAHRLAVMSTVLAALTVILLWYLARDLQRLVLRQADAANPWPATVAAAALGTSPVFWSQAVVTEVYALHGLLFVAVLLLLARWVRRVLVGSPHHVRWIVAAGLVLGLGLGNHLTIAVLLPVLGVAAAWGLRRRALGWRQLGLLALAFLAGLSVYAYLPLSAAQAPPINWGAPRDLSGFLWTVSATPYRDYAFGLPLGQVPERLVTWLRLALVEQFTPLGAIIALLGAWHLSDRSRPLLAITGGLALAVTVYAVGYNTLDSYVYLIPAFMMMAVWIAVGLSWFQGFAPSTPPDRSPSWHRHIPTLLGISAVVLISGITIATRYGDISLRDDRDAYLFGQGVFREVEEGAVVLTWSDLDIFPVWYFRYGLGERPDVTVVEASFLQWDWYVDDLRRRYPSLLPEELPPDAYGRIWSLVARVLPSRPVYVTSRSNPVFQEYETEQVNDVYRVIGPLGDR